MRGRFNIVVLVCPTYHHNKGYRDFAQGDPGFIALAPDASDEGELDELLRPCSVLFDQGKVLLIVYDCALSKDIKKGSSQLIQLAFSGRRRWQSVWVLTQQWGSVAKPFRDNCSFVVAFHSPSAKDFDALMENVGAGLAREEETQLRRALKEHPHARIFFHRRHPFNVVLESGFTHRGRGHSTRESPGLGSGRIHARYQAILSRKVQKTAVSGVLRIAVKALGDLLPFLGMRLRDEAALLRALQKDELVTTTSSTTAYPLTSR